MFPKRGLRINVTACIVADWRGCKWLKRLFKLRAGDSAALCCVLVFRHNPGPPQFRCWFPLCSIPLGWLLLLRTHNTTAFSQDAIVSRSEKPFPLYMNCIVGTRARTSGYSRAGTSPGTGYTNILCAGSFAASGSVNVKQEPNPGVLVTSMRPCCASTICLTIASPRPEPPVAREREASAR